MDVVQNGFVIQNHQLKNGNCGGKVTKHLIFHLINIEHTHLMSHKNYCDWSLN